MPTPAPRNPPPTRTVLRRERKRVAELLHNTLCQDLTGIGLMASAAARQLHPTSAEAEEKFQELAGMIQRVGASLRELVQSLQAEK